MKKSIIFEELQQVVLRLKPFEAEVAENYLTGFERSNNSDLNKSATALKHMIANPEISYDSLKAFISPEADRYTFNKFLTRLRDKIFDSLLLDANINREGAYSGWFSAKQDCTKKMILISNLIGRGNEISAIQLTESVIKKAKAFELYDILTNVLFIKKLEFGLRKGEKAFDLICKEHKLAERCHFAMQKASEYNVRHFMITDRQASQNEKVGFLTEALSDLQNLYAETGVSQVGYHLQVFNMEYNQAMGNFEEARENGQKLMDIVQNSAALNSPIRLAGAFLNNAYNDMFLFDFEVAKDKTEQCLARIGIGSYNYIVAASFRAQLEYFSGDFEKCLSLAEGLLATSFIKIAPFEKSKLQYIKACALFNLGQFHKAYAIFNNDSILMEADKEGWNVGFRIMRIICLIEMSMKDLADMSIESMRKHMQKSDDEKSFTERDKTIIKILRNLEHKNFDFKETYFKNQSLFYLLASDKTDHCWKIKSHELIVFHNWFILKMQNKAYQFTVPTFQKIEEVKLNGRAESWEE
jgi:tetratricopeptide (TPR) repeat protein